MKHKSNYTKNTYIILKYIYRNYNLYNIVTFPKYSRVFLVISIKHACVSQKANSESRFFNWLFSVTKFVCTRILCDFPK